MGQAKSVVLTQDEQKEIGEIQQLFMDGLKKSSFTPTEQKEIFSRMLILTGKAEGHSASPISHYPQLYLEAKRPGEQFVSTITNPQKVLVVSCNEFERSFNALKKQAKKFASQGDEFDFTDEVELLEKTNTWIQHFFSFYFAEKYPTFQGTFVARFDATQENGWALYCKR